MASFTIRSAASSGIYAKLVLTEQSQSVANNTTTLAWQLYMWNTQAKPNWYAYEEHNIVRVLINGQYVINTDDFGMISLQYEQTESSAKLISSGTITIAHNSDGTKSIKASFYVEQGWYGAYSWTGPETTISLTTIARASTPTLSVSEVTLGGNVTIYTNRAAGFTHTLKYSIGSASGTIATGVTDSYTWQNIPKTLAQQFPNSPSGNVTITCETYNGSTPIGFRTAILKVLPSSDMAPTISIAVSEAGDIPSSISGYVKTKSKLYIDPSITYKYGASLKSIIITANGATYYEEPVTTGYLSTADSNTITVTVTDTRGMSKTETTSVTVADYSPPRIDSLTAYRCNASGVADVEGSHMKAVISGEITSLSGNTRTCTMYYKTADATNYSSQQSITLSSYAFSNVSSAVIGASTTNSYDVKVVIGDSFGNVAPYYATVSTASILMNILKDKSGMAIGKMAEKSGVLQLGWDLELKGDPTADNHAVTKRYVDNTKQPLYQTMIDLRGFNENVWYPVTATILDSGIRRIDVHSTLSSVCKPSWCTHDGGFYANLSMLVQACGWGTSNACEMCLVHDYKWATDNPTGYMQLSNASVAVVYLRGGGCYTIRTDWDSAWGVWSTDYTASGQTATLRTESPGVTFIRKGRIEANITGNVIGDLDGTAAKANRIRPTSGETYGTGNRLSSANIAPRSDSSLYTFLATSSMTEGKPNGDGNILHMEWDNGGWSTQLFIPHSSNKPMQFRHMADGTWMSYWISLLDSDSVADYPVAQATSGHGIWSFIKFNSGIAMCWGRTAVYNTTFPGTWGSWRVNDYLFPAQRFPFDFVDIPQVFASQGNPGTTACDWAIYSDGAATTQYTPKYSVFRPAAVSATVNLSLNLFAIGRWK